MPSRKGAHKYYRELPREGKIELTCPLGTTHCVPQEKFPESRDFLVKMAGYWPRSLFCMFMYLDFVSVHKHAKKNLANIQPS